MGVVEVAEVLEGEYCPTADLFFEKIGNSIPIFPDLCFDSNFIPSVPLAFCQHHCIVFLAHSSGFCVAGTKNVVDASMNLKPGGSVLDVCIVNVNKLHGDFRVRILALSSDSSTLAVASFSNEILSFSVPSLLKKDQTPLFSFFLNPQDAVKDLKWSKAAKNDFIVLSLQKELHIGTVGSPLKFVLNNVDAAEWSPGGHHVAVASENSIIFFSSSLNEEFRVAIPANSWASDSYDTSAVKVDSLSWVRQDSVIVGCIHLNEAGEEETYVVHVITNKKGKITNVNPELVVTSFYDMFLNVADDVNSFATGPYLQLNYLKSRQLAVSIHKKNIDQHIMLLSWSACENGTSDIFAIELAQDSWLPRIELQGNGDHNSVLGFCIDETSICGKIVINSENEEQKELLPDCVLICMTLEGKLLMFNVASTCQLNTQLLVNSSDDEKQDILNEYNTLSKNCDIPFDSRKETLEMTSIEPIVHVSSQSNVTGNIGGFQATEANKGNDSSNQLDSRGENFRVHDHFVGSNSLAFTAQSGILKSLPMKADIDSLPSISIQPLLSLQESTSLSRDLSDSSKDNFKALVVPNLERKASSPLTSIQTMTEELDTLLQGIEAVGGFGDTCKRLFYVATEKLEKEMDELYKKCHVSKAMIDTQHQKIQYLLEKTVQVLTKKSYLDDIIKQSSDVRYWELWDRQNLTSELDLKRKQIQQFNLDITNQIIKLEKHLNSLEFQKFGEQNGGSSNRRFLRGPEHSRLSMPLPSLQNTMHSQLSVAEQLSERLSRQIALLKIESPAQPKSIKTELFETVGIEQDASFISPKGTSGSLSFKDHPSNSKSNTAKQSSWRSQLRKTTCPDSESRRVRNFLDQGMGTLTPTKTTVKRIPFSNQPNSICKPSQQFERLQSSSSFLKGDPTSQKNLELSKQQPVPIEQNIDFSPVRMSKESVEVTCCSTSDKSSTYLGSSSQNLFSTLPGLGSPFLPKNNETTFKSFDFKIANLDLEKNKVPFAMNSGELPQTNLNATAKSSVPSGTLFGFSSITQLPLSLNTVASLELSKNQSISSKDSSMKLFSSSFPDSSLSPVKFGDNPFATVMSSSVSSSTISTPSIPSEAVKIEAPPSLNEILASTNSVQQLPTDEQAYKATGSSPSLTSATIFGTPSVSTKPVITESSHSLQEPSKGAQEEASGNTQNKLEVDEALPVSVSHIDSSETASDKSNEVAAANLDAIPESVSASQFPVFDTNRTEVLADSVGADDDMEEEAPENDQMDMLSFDNLMRFGTASNSTSTSTSARNPFGPLFGNATSNQSSSSAFSMQVSGGELFRPASFNIPSTGSAMTSQSTSAVNFGASSFGKAPGSGGFGQPAKLGVGQQALGSVLGSFGQSRQIGGGFTASGFSSPNVFGASGGFSGGATSGGFGAPASVNQGFASLGSGGGFAAAPSSGGGGFGASASGGGFSSFSKQQEQGGFLAFGGKSGADLPASGGGFSAFNNKTVGNPGEKPVDLFTQMRK